MDELSLESHRRAWKATEAGTLQREIAPIMGVKMMRASCSWSSAIKAFAPRPRWRKCHNFNLCFRQSGVTTAGNSSQISDGAAAALVMSAAKAQQLGLRARARIVEATTVGSDPHLMLTGPIPATRKVLQRAYGMAVEDIDLFEVNEAFASVPRIWERDIGVDLDRVNIYGGAIALGHPLGGSGARLMTTLINALETTGSRYGLQTMCCGGGMATATIIERIET